MVISAAQKLDRFFSAYPKRSYAKGQILIFANEDPEYIFYLLKGSVRQYDVSYRGDEVVMNIFKPPAFFPMSWAVTRKPNTYLYRAETPAEVHIAPVEATLAFVKANPDVLFDLLSRIYIGMDGLLGRMMHLMAGTARSRLMYELIIECRRFGEKSKNGHYRLSTTESDIAARTGLSRETISREMQKLKSEGLVYIDNEGLHVNDLQLLEKSLGGEI